MLHSIRSQSTKKIVKRITMKKIASLIAVVLIGVGGVGCHTGGPAKTTLSSMKNVGPLSLMERTTNMEIKDGKTNTIVRMVESIESPEAAQARLRDRELKERGKQGGSPRYWWQVSPYGDSYNSPFGGGGVNGTPGGYVTPYGGGWR